MDHLSAMARGIANRGREQKVFDWDKAAKIIVECGVKGAVAGLSGDFEYTGDQILIDGIPQKEHLYCYFASTWATPQLLIDGKYIDCYKMESDTDWDHETVWPESALAILKANQLQSPSNTSSN